MSWDPGQSRCGRCGAPTRIQVVKGLNVQSCVSCGAYTLDQLTLERLLGGPTTHWGATPDPGHYRGESPAPPVYLGAPTIPAPPPPPPALPGELPPSLPSQAVPTWRPATPGAFSNPPMAAQPHQPHPPVPYATSRPPEADPATRFAAENAARQSRATMLLALGVLGLVAIAMVVVALFLVQGLTGRGRTEVAQVTVPPTDLDEVLTQPEPAATAAPAPSVSVEPAHPTPAPPPPPAPPSDSLRTHLERGWNVVDTDPSTAAGHFQRALDLKPSHPEANYGYGYALLEQGNASGAKPFLCAALSGSDVEMQRDVTSLLANNQLSCP